MLADIELYLNQIETDSEINQNKIDSVVNRIVSVFSTASEESFGKTKVPTVNRNKTGHPWYGKECAKERRIYHRTKHKYNSAKTDHTKQQLLNQAKTTRKH